MHNQLPRRNPRGNIKTGLILHSRRWGIKPAPGNRAPTGNRAPRLKRLGVASLATVLTACGGHISQLPSHRSEVISAPTEGHQSQSKAVLDIREIEPLTGTGELWSREDLLSASTLPEGRYPTRIALLLPITSSLGSAADAFQRGFMDAYQRSGLHHIDIRVYDTGAEVGLASLYYRAAVNEGREVVVGPFGKAAVESLLQSEQMRIPALLIGTIPKDRFIGNAWGLSLSPEQEARAAAQRALQEGRTRASVLFRGNDWGNRVKQAFIDTFTRGGGHIASQSPFSPGADQASASIKRMLALDQSERRHTALKSALGIRLHFSAQRRNDIDLIFLAGNHAEARRVAPQLKYYRAHNLPVYATSAVFSGKSDPITDADLAGLRFPDLPWMLTGFTPFDPNPAPPPQADDNIELAESPEPARAAITPGSSQRLRGQQRSLPYGGSALDRLYALGETAFGVIPKLNTLTRDSQARYQGETMTVGVADNGDLIREMQWARFTDDGIQVETINTSEPHR